ncbi:trypsin-3-like [Mya arenaria]|uniref:trypsin-3-like n=1 Tax=Mya arenaria TaxID=6604 RepID=UPI0022DFDC7F|nr:trypsin-3-like [Mya arenaria]
MIPGVNCDGQIRASGRVDQEPLANTGDAARNIIGGERADRNEYKYQVYFTENDIFICSGTILDSVTVLTAAHCFESGLNNGVVHQVVAGDYRYQANDGTEQVRSLRALAIHPDYDTNDFMSPDIAVLKLSRPFNFNTNVGEPVKIPSPNESPDRLQELKLPIKSFSQCQSTALSYYEETWNSKFLCTISSGKSVCNGDSGSPIVCFLNNTPFQLGIVSWHGSDCATDGFSAYTRTLSHRGWILARIANL